MKSLCVFCGANAGNRPLLGDTARAMGEALARRGITLVFGGGRVGLMGAVSAAARVAGGRVVGVIPAALQKKELAYEGADLTELIVVRSMHERKARMAELADGFVALPGGYGTCEEICEMITWAQLGIHRKPCGLVNVDGYFDGLLAQFDRAVAEGLLRAPHRGLVVAAPDPDALLDAMAAWTPPPLEFKLDWQST
ncbi:MAG TPA: TIGR00730 family Rossman fold protein [Burkholderiales bacterium]|nr:TIGR00730 family Rossman fold protein [Burkholderiales bacterium]